MSTQVQEFKALIGQTTGDKWHIKNDPDGGFQIVATAGESKEGTVIAVVGGENETDASMNAVLIKATKNLLPTFIEHYDLMKDTVVAALDLMGSSQVYINDESDVKYQTLLTLLEKAGFGSDAVLPTELRDAVQD